MSNGLVDGGVVPVHLDHLACAVRLVHAHPFEVATLQGCCTLLCHCIRH